MSILRFRITFEDYDDIHRDIDLEVTHTFADLFSELLKSINFDNRHKGVFYLADHNWRRGEKIGEITGEQQEPLNKVELVEHIDDPHQKFLFTYDEEAQWNFTIELIRIMGSPEYRATYPKIVASAGAPPVQYKETLIIPTRERTEPDGRGRKKRAAVAEEDEDELLLAAMAEDDEPDEGGEIADSAPDEVSMELPPDMELETDSEISRLAEEFNNTIEMGDDTGQREDDEYGSGEDDEYGNGEEEDEYGSGGYRGGEDYDD